MLTGVRISVIIVSCVLTYFFAQPFGALYSFFFPSAVGGGFIGAPGVVEWIVGLPLILIFLLTFFIHAIGGKDVWWWNIIALVPVILFEIAFDPLRLYFPLLLAFTAWGLGVLIHKTLTNLAPSFMAKVRG